MTTFNCRTFVPLLIVLSLLIRCSCAKNSTVCYNESGSDCWLNEWKVRDTTCAAKRLHCRYSYEFITTKDTIGRCYCCRKSSALQDPELPDCPLLNGVVTNITILGRQRNPEITSRSLEVSYSPQNGVNNTITLRGMDVKQVIYHGFLWKKRLESCQVKSGITLNKQLWEDTWTDEIKFRDMFLAKLCNQSDPKDHLSQKRIILSNKTFIVERNVRNLAANESVIADRYYVTDRFSYSILLNITGVYDNFDNLYGAVGVEELEDSLGQSGLTFLQRLDNFTILAEAKVFFDSEFLVSTVHKLVDIVKN